jgi:hypothetical protein
VLFFEARIEEAVREFAGRLPAGARVLDAASTYVRSAHSLLDGLPRY